MPLSGNHTGQSGNADGMGILLKNIWKAKEGFYEGVGMKIEQIIVVLVVVILVGLTGVLIGHFRSYNLGYIDGVNDGNVPCICETDCDCKECEPCICICNPSLSSRCPVESQLQRIARNVAGVVEYGGSVSDMVCKDKASELRGRLIDAGYENVHVMKGWLWWCDEEDYCSWVAHDWVCFTGYDNEDCILAIDSVTGEILSPDYYHDNYREGR